MEFKVLISIIFENLMKISTLIITFTTGNYLSMARRHIFLNFNFSKRLVSLFVGRAEEESCTRTSLNLEKGSKSPDRKIDFSWSLVASASILTSRHGKISKFWWLVKSSLPWWVELETWKSWVIRSRTWTQDLKLRVMTH